MAPKPLLPEVAEFLTVFGDPDKVRAEHLDDGHWCVACPPGTPWQECGYLAWAQAQDRPRR